MTEHWLNLQNFPHRASPSALDLLGLVEEVELKKRGSPFRENSSKTSQAGRFDGFQRHTGRLRKLQPGDSAGGLA